MRVRAVSSYELVMGKKFCILLQEECTEYSNSQYLLQ